MDDGYFGLVISQRLSIVCPTGEKTSKVRPQRDPRNEGLLSAVVLVLGLPSAGVVSVRHWVWISLVHPIHVL